MKWESESNFVVGTHSRPRIVHSRTLTSVADSRYILSRDLTSSILKMSNFISVSENMVRSFECAAGERDFLEGLVVQLLVASRGEPPPPCAVPPRMARLFEALKARAASTRGEKRGRKSSMTPTTANNELNRELGSADQTRFNALLSPLLYLSYA